MKTIYLVSLLVLTGCLSTNRHPRFYFNDLVKVKYSGSNLFYSKACEHKGFVYSIVDLYEDLYIVKVSCSIKNSKDIVESFEAELFLKEEEMKKIKR